MREEHPSQQELPDFQPPGATSAQVSEMSEVAEVQNKALDLGLVREVRPVFVYDAKLAKEKTGNAQRQAKHRELRESKGLVMAEVPREIVELVKTAHGGDWLKLSQVKLASGVPPEPPFSEKVKVSEVPEVTVHSVITTEKLKDEITSDGGIEPWLQKKIDFAIDSLPKPAPISLKIVERIVEKPVLKLTAEQKIDYEIGKRVRKLTGWRARILSLIL